MGVARSTAYAKETTPKLRYAAATLAFVSESMKLWVVPGQLAAAMLPGIFFLLVTACQGLFGASLLFGAGKWTRRFGTVNCSIILSTHLEGLGWAGDE